MLEASADMRRPMKAIPGELEALLKAKVMADAVQAEIASAAKGKLAPFEVPKKIALDAEPWTPENDMVTAAFKLKRQNLVAAFRQRIDAQY